MSIGPRAMTEFEIDMARHAILMLPRRKIYLEIGSDQGGSLNFFGRLMDRDGLLVCVDLRWSSSMKNVVEDIRRASYNVELVQGDSRQVVEQVNNVLAGRPVDVLLIDGDHSNYGAAADAHHYVPLVGPGGVAMFHDCGRHTTLAGPDGNRNMASVRGAYEAAAYGKRTLIVQEHTGLGLVYV